MVQDFGGSHVAGPQLGDFGLRDRRRSNLRSVVVLCLASLLLIAFILRLGDYRRKQNAMAVASRVAADFQKRVGSESGLPIHLDPVPIDLGIGPALLMHAITENDARTLRMSTKPIIAAHGDPIPGFLSRNGRAVVIFESGVFRPEWLSEIEFRELQERQTTEISRLRQ